MILPEVPSYRDDQDRPTRNRVSAQRLSSHQLQPDEWAHRPVEGRRQPRDEAPHRLLGLPVAVQRQGRRSEPLPRQLPPPKAGREQSPTGGSIP